MKFVLAPDSFKESMKAIEVAEAMEKGIKKVLNNAQCIKVPMADGGEGTTHALVHSTNGILEKIKVLGPLGKEVEGEIGILGEGKVAIIEMASASGLELLSKEERNPMITTTFGTGQLIKAALDKGVEKILIGIGGSATNDGGTGMLKALGAKFMDEEGKELPLGGGELLKLKHIDISGLDKRIKDVDIEVACDVTNPLTGEKGAAYVFAPQKGADKNMVKILDEGLKVYSNIIKETLNKDIENVEGAGAAGGLGAGLMAFLDANLKKGIDMVIEYTGLEEKIKDCDFVFTGEGSIDSQTIYGKTPIGVAKLAKKYNKPVIAFAGKIGEGVENLYDNGINSIIGILPEICTLEEALKDGNKNMEKAAENIARIIKLK
ncbi:glycerate kinase [Clostridium hydrogeniformans]|uniref:glycerate kinase family protein n=1 Tax=Clostridium hydrogeniformans TaxID=349933 RepID=UPI000487CC83|nr:glycerate kinase [Clostridium hydrogeniformans]